MSDRLRVLGFVRSLQSGWERRLWMCCAPGRERGLGARTGSSRRTGYSVNYRRKWPNSSNSRWSGVVWSPSGGPRDADDSGLFNRTLVDSTTVQAAHSPPTGPRGNARPATGCPQSSRCDVLQRRWLCVRGVQSLGRSIAGGEMGLMASILGLVHAGCGPGHVRCGRGHADTPFPAIAVAPGSAPSFDISVTTSDARPRRPVGRQRPDRLDRGPARRRVHRSTGSRPTARRPRPRSPST